MPREFSFKAKADEIVYVGERFNLIYTLNAEGNNFRGPDFQGLDGAFRTLYFHQFKCAGDQRQSFKNS